MAVPECAHRLMRCRPSLVRGRAAQVNPGGFTTPARRPSVPHRTAGCGKSSLRPLMAGSSPSLPDGSNPSAAIVQSASDVQCSGSVAKIVKLEHAWRRLDGRNDDGFQVAPFPG
ncbi:transposase [Pseudomonas aeruginosa]|nr:transposase [Pseudomonas aeruginosa]